MWWQALLGGVGAGVNAASKIGQSQQSENIPQLGLGSGTGRGIWFPSTNGITQTQAILAVLGQASEAAGGIAKGLGEEEEGQPNLEEIGDVNKIREQYGLSNPSESNLSSYMAPKDMNDYLTQLINGANYKNFMPSYATDSPWGQQ